MLTLSSLIVAASSVVPADREFGGGVRIWMGPMDRGVDFAGLSTRDVSEYGSTGACFMIKEGYGALVARMGAPLPVRLATPATGIDWGGDGVAVETPAPAALPSAPFSLSVNTPATLVKTAA